MDHSNTMLFHLDWLMDQPSSNGILTAYFLTVWTSLWLFILMIFWYTQRMKVNISSMCKLCWNSYGRLVYRWIHRSQSSMLSRQNTLDLWFPQMGWKQTQTKSLLCVTGPCLYQWRVYSLFWNSATTTADSSRTTARLHGCWCNLPGRMFHTISMTNAKLLFNIWKMHFSALQCFSIMTTNWKPV